MIWPRSCALPNLADSQPRDLLRTPHCLFHPHERLKSFEKDKEKCRPIYL